MLDNSQTVFTKFSQKLLIRFDFHEQGHVGLDEISLLVLVPLPDFCSFLRKLCEHDFVKFSMDVRPNDIYHVCIL